MISRVSTVGVYVRDQDKALEFYTDKLGFEVRKHVDEPDFKWFEVAPPGGETTIVLCAPDYQTGDESKIGRYTEIAFHADDMRELHRVYTERGVKFTQEPRLEPYGVWFAAFIDQDENEYFVFQP